MSSDTIHVLTEDERERDMERMRRLDTLSANESASISESEPSTAHDEYDLQDPIVNDAFEDIHDTWAYFIENHMSQARQPCPMCNGTWLCPGCLAIMHSQEEVIAHAFKTHNLELPFFPVNHAMYH